MWNHDYTLDPYLTAYAPASPQGLQATPAITSAALDLTCGGGCCSGCSAAERCEVQRGAAVLLYNLVVDEAAQEAVGISAR